MEASEIRNSIDRNERLIDDCNGKISELNHQIEELEQLRSRIDYIACRFNEKQTQRMSSVSRISNMSETVKLAGAYAGGMNELVTGAESRNVSDGLDTAKERVGQEIQRLQEEADSLRREIYSLRENNSYLFSQYTLLDTGE